MFKIPSDYWGIGYASCTGSDDEGVRLAAIDISKRHRLHRVGTRDGGLYSAIEGVWRDAVVSTDEKSVISSFKLRSGAPGEDLVNGRAWDPSGEPRVEFWSASSKFDAATKTLSYSWEGIHARKRGVS